MAMNEIESLYNEVTSGRIKLDQLNQEGLKALQNYAYAKDTKYTTEQPQATRMTDIAKKIQNYNYPSTQPEAAKIQSDNVRARYTGTPPEQAKVGKTFKPDLPNYQAIKNYPTINQAPEKGLFDMLGDARRKSFESPQAFQASLGQFISGVTKGASLGLTDSKLVPDSLRQAEDTRTTILGKQDSDTIKNTGEIVGSLLPGVGAYNLASKAVSKLPKMGKLATEATKGALAGGLYQSAVEGIGAAVGREEKAVGERIANIGLATAAGAILDPAIVFGSELAKKAYQRLSQRGKAKVAEIIDPGGKETLALPEYNRPIGLPQPSEKARQSATTKTNVFPVQPTNVNKARTKKVIRQQGNFERELVGQQLRKPIGLPSGQTNPVTRGRVVNPTKELQDIYMQKLEDFSSFIKQKYKGQSATEAELLNDWSSFADQFDPDFFTAVDWAYPDPTAVKQAQNDKLIRVFGSLENAKGAISRGRDYLKSREAAGLKPLVNRQFPDPFVGEAIGPVEKIGVRSNLSKQNQKNVKVFGDLPVKEQPIKSIEPSNDVTVRLAPVSKFVPEPKQPITPTIDQERLMFENKVKRFFGNDVDLTKFKTDDLFDLSNQIDEFTSGVRKVKPSLNSAVKQIDQPIVSDQIQVNEPKESIVNQAKQPIIKSNQLKELDDGIKELEDQLNLINAEREAQIVSVTNEYWNGYKSSGGKVKTYDPIMDEVQRSGFIRVPSKESFYYEEYKGLSGAVKRKYFRSNDKALQIDEMSDVMGISANDLLSKLKDGNSVVSIEELWLNDFVKKYGNKPTKTQIAQFVREQFDSGDIPFDETTGYRENVEGIQSALNYMKQDREELVNVKQENQGFIAPDNQELRYAIPLPKAKGKNVEPITIQEVLDTMRNELGVTIRKGRMKAGRGVLGFFRVKPAVIRSKTHGDIQVLSHEIGHALDKRYDFENAGFDRELLDFINKVSPKHLSNYSPDQYVPEAIAEYFRQFFVDRQVAETLAPKFTQHIRNTLTEKELVGLNKVTDAIERWVEQGAYEQLAGRIDYDGKESNPTLRNMAEKIYENVVDKNYPLAKFEMLMRKKTEKGKGSLFQFLRGQDDTLMTAKDSPYKLARLYEGTPEKMRLFIEQNLNPIFDKLDQFGIQVKELAEYATAVHARDLQAKKIESGFTNEQINATINKLGTPNMETAHKMLMNMNANLRKIMLDSGLIDTDTYNALVTKHPNYVPFYRFFDEKDNVEGFKGLSKTFVDVNAPIKRIKGSDRPILNPLESMVKNAAMVIDAAERNKVGQALWRLADNDDAGAFVERLGPGQTVSRENIATVMINGEKQQLQFNSPELYNAFKNLDLKSSGFVEDVLTIPAQVIRNAITATPSFWLRSMMLDEFHAYLVSNEKLYLPYVDLLRGFFIKAKRPDLYDRWVNSGGAYGTFFSQDRKYLQAVLESLKTDKKGLAKAVQYIRITPKLLQEILQYVPNQIEEARRLTIFKDLVENKNYSDEEAALIARDLIDFQKRGAMMHGLSRTTPFLNPNIQGKDKTLRSFLNSPAKFAARGLVGLTIPTIAIYAYNKRNANEEQKKKINEAPEWMSNTNFLIAIPNTNEVARIPKPFDVSWAFANSAEQAMKFMDKNDPQSLEEFFKTNFVEDTIPQLLSPILPIYEVAANYNFHSDSPIVNDTLEKRMPKDQYDVYTAKLARYIGETTNLSPKKIEYIMNAYGGDYSRVGNALFDYTAGNSIYSNDPKRPASDLFLKPITNRYAVSESYQPKSVSKFYDEFEKIQSKVNSAKFNKESAEFGKYRAMQKFFYRMQDIQKRRRTIEQNEFMSATEKRDQLNGIRDQLAEVARQGNKIAEGRQ